VSTTFTAASQRDRRDHVRRAAPPITHQGLLLVTTLVAVMAVGLSYAGRVRSSTPAAGTRVVNLNTVTDVKSLDAALATVFPDGADRRFAATHLLTYLESLRTDDRQVPNVGAIMGATVSSGAVTQSASPLYKDRLRRAVERADTQDRERPATIALFTADDLSAIKPGLVVRTRQAFRTMTLRWGALYLAAIWLVVLAWRIRAPGGDVVLLGAVHVLTAIGFAVVLSRADPLRDTALFVRYVQGVLVGCTGLALVSLIDFRRTALAAFTYVPLAGALLLSVLLLLFGSGPGGSNAKVNLGPIQPVEGIRLLLGLFLAGYFARRWELLRQTRGRTFRDITLPSWLHLPRVDYLLPVTVGVGVALLFFFLQKDLGPALFVSCVFLATYAIARDGFRLAAIGLGVLVAGFYAGYALNVSSTLSARVNMWHSAWDNVARGGDQIAQAIWALSTGGVFGAGLGLGDTRYVPAGHTDLPLAAIGEELGFVGLLCVGGAFALIGWRGFTTAMRASSDYAFFLATILTLFLIFPALLMAAGMLGVAPLTGVVTPFVSYGGSAMLANCVAIGILSAIGASDGAGRAAETPLANPFYRGVRALVGTIAVAAAALIVVLLNVQVLRADRYAVKPHLGMQADGVRRYQYNPRIMDVIAQIPRGSVFDRSGLPLATSDRAVAERAEADYKKRGIDVWPCTPSVESGFSRMTSVESGFSRIKSDERCYPLGASAFHLLGDVSNRRNWGAGNSSYVERDLQDRLRGFDDHAAAVSVVSRDGRPAPTLLRDYTELLPLLRHRRQPDHATFKAFRTRTRDVTLTVDAPFQVRVARILGKYASRTPTGRAAAVVIDPATGGILASVSYPLPSGGWPSPVAKAPADKEGRPDDEGGGETDANFDRARYGLYAPGSTFKLVTAAAALRLDPGSWNSRYMCTRQDDGRVGARVQGYGVIRDDLLDTHPHGSIAMHDAIVQSCNAYFAQLAVRLGPRPLLDTAALAGISTARDDSAARLGATLPQAGYGQGDVVTTPLRMARVASAIANGGLLRDPLIATGAAAPGKTREPQRLLSPHGSRLLGDALRDAVLSGTGRSISGHPWRIAGKTGTAENSNAPSHAWFIGFAPHGRAEKKIAFAVLFEHAGYGGSIAAPAAGEIVSAAAASGLVQ
jgi:cell division protein FtsW (lipid II flippase)/cell division protein FtsI/penicillin-binding protein 2